MACPIDDVRDINNSKDFWKIIVMIIDLRSVTSVSNKEHLKMVLIDAKETTCATVVILENFEVGQFGWYYDGCGECTKSVAVKDGKLKCFSDHETDELVQVLGVDGKFKSSFIFWDNDCVKLIGKSVLELKRELTEAGEDNPLEFPYPLDATLKKELTIRVVFQPKYGRLYVVGFRDNEESHKKIRDNFKSEEHTSKVQISEPSSHYELASYSEPMSAYVDYDPASENSGLTPSKRYLSDMVEYLENVQLSYKKLMKDVKKEN
ncbi:hypothetical protein KIW84_045960 [Lathyrus oleraceus]|uniref:Uncharacterized protein n=1 Tax=Pisum sativum TaxID=3888 RepID=A0A9D5AUV1_PEA|nr:hypothetical protein KIW84_045960 [Pisum sativum]